MVSRPTSRTGGVGQDHYAHLAFHYSVGGQSYTAELYDDFVSSQSAPVRAKVERYAVGTRHRIRYNPADPQDIRLDAGYNLITFLKPLVALLIGLVFIGFGVLFRLVPKR